MLEVARCSDFESPVHIANQYRKNAVWCFCLTVFMRIFPFSLSIESSAKTSSSHMDTLSMLSREDSESDEHTLSKRACMENEVLQGASARDVRKERFIYVERVNSLNKSYIHDHSHSSF